MSDWTTWAVLVPYYAVLGLLSLYGLHRLLLTRTFLRGARTREERPAEPDEWPMVTVQLPIYNESSVAARLLEAVARLDYPTDRLEIQVLDDSTDETRGIVAARVAELRRRGLDVHHLVRADRTGYKAGALAAGLERARGERIAVFDADFVPPPDFLRRTLPWLADPGVGLVQARWGHLNGEWSSLTRSQALLLDGHFVIEHAARARRGCFFNFNGTAGVWRREAIEESGGWEHDTLTEDLDLSYRAQLAGWRFVYLPDVVAPAELPASVAALESQQRRWAKGSIQTARKLLPGILRAPLPARVKLEAAVHLTNNAAYLLMVLLALLVHPAMRLRWNDGWRSLLWLDLGIFLAATGSVLWFYATTRRALGLPRLGNWRIGLSMGLGFGLALNNARAVLEGLVQRGGVFERTPKRCLEDGVQAPAVPVEASRWRGSLWSQAALASYLGACTISAIRDGMWPGLPFLLLFFGGSLYVVALDLAAARHSASRPGRVRPTTRLRGG